MSLNDLGGATDSSTMVSPVLQGLAELDDPHQHRTHLTSIHPNEIDSATRALRRSSKVFIDYFGETMNEDTIKGNWKQMTGKVKEQWGKLTDDDMTVIDGKRDQLVGKIQERHGILKDAAEDQVNQWEKTHGKFPY